MASGPSLSYRGRACVADLKDLCTKLRNPNCKYLDQISPSAVEDESRRFMVWANNIGALQGPHKQSSLDYRLKEAPQVRQQVIRLLDRLGFSAAQASAICAGRRPNRIEDDSDLDDEESSDDLQEHEKNTSEVSEIRELYLAISGSVTRLFKLSMVIRNPTPRDRYKRLASIEPLGSFFDVWHVREKFPEVEKHLWLAERLGKANAQRRDYFRYRRNHKEKLAKEAAEEYERRLNEQPGSTERQEGEDMKKESNTPPNCRAESSLGSTKASTFVPPSTNLEEIEKSSDTGQSETSYATSVEEGNFKALHVPPPPAEFDIGLAFECPYCYTIQSPSNKQAWKKHVFNDLQPYICTFESCPSKPFASRQTWFDHELQVHRKEWVCSLCEHSAFPSPASFRLHLQEYHHEKVTDRQISTMLDLCEEPIDKIRPEDCLLCCDWASSINTRELAANPKAKPGTLMVTPVQSRRHLAAHLEQLALFALPRNYGGEDASKIDSNDAVIDASSDDISIVDLSADGSDSLEDGEEDHPLYLAAASGQVDDVRKLLEAGADANARGKNQDYALQAAALLGFDVIAKLLIEHGADVNSPAGPDRTAIQLARSQGHGNIVDLLLKSGADSRDGNYIRQGLTSRQDSFDKERALIDIWGEMFDELDRPTRRLGQFLRGIAIYLIEEYEPRHSIVIGPEKMQKFYIETRLESEPYEWELIFDDRRSSISRLYRAFEIEHHLIQEQENHSWRPDIPALTPLGFSQWMAILIQSHPLEERERLDKVVMNSPINNADDRKERFPKRLAAGKFPKFPKYGLRKHLQNNFILHCNLGRMNLYSQETTTSQDRDLDDLLRWQTHQFQSSSIPTSKRVRHDPDDLPHSFHGR